MYLFWEYVWGRNSDYYILIDNTFWVRCKLSHDKNESVFLLSLEQDRQNNQARTLDETNPNSVVQLPSIPCSIPAIQQKVYEDEGVQSASGETSDLELLFKEKAGLEEESHFLDEEQGRLNLRARMVTAELVQEMKKNSEKRQEIIGLREQIGRLETQLGLEELVQETEMSNGEKQQEIVDLQATVGLLETQLEGLSVSDASGEGKAETIDYCSYTLVSIISQEELPDSDQNATVVEIIEEIR